MNLFVDWQNIVVFLLAFFNIGLGLLLLPRGKEIEYNKAYGLFAISVGFWCLGISMYRGTEDIATGWFWVKEYYLVAAILVPFFLNFVLDFPDKTKKLSLSKKILLYAPLIIIIWLLYFATNLHIKALRQDLTPNQAEIGWGYNIFGIWWLAYALTAFYVLSKKFFSARGSLKIQMTYLYIGTLIPFVLGAFFNLFLPWVGNYRLIEWGPIFTSVLVSIIAYAIVRHRLMDIHVIIRRSLIYSFLLVSVLLFFAFLAVWGPNLLFGRTETIELDDLAVIFLLVFAVRPLQRLFEQVTDKVFYQARYNAQNTIYKLSRELSSIVGLDKLEHKVTDTLVRIMRLQGMAVLRKEFSEQEGDFFVLGNQQGFDFWRKEHTFRQGELLHYFEHKKEAVILEELEQQLNDDDGGDEQIQILITEMQQMKASIAIPLVSNKQLIGAFILGEKKSGNPFTNQDLELLDLLAHQAAVALDNAMLYAGLENRVSERTEQLNEKNKYLMTLQRLTNQIIQSVDFNELAWKIVDLIHEEMGYVGAFMLSYEEVTGDIRLVAITKTSIIDKALKVIGDTKKIKGNISQETKTGEVIRSRELYITTKLSDLISPVVPAKVASAAQKIVKVKALAAVPIIAEGNIYGTINFMVARKPEQITAQEKDLMISLAQLVAIVIRNSKYYEEIEDANKKMQRANETINDQLKQLEDANRHLKRLDKAKTEFLSIASHQLRTPLSAIRGYLSLMEEGDYGEMSDKQKEVLQKTGDNVRRLVALVNDLLSLARIEAGTGPKGLNLETVDFRKLVDMTVEELELKAKNKGLEIRWERPEEPLEMEMDKEKMEQVVMNLTDNALNYTLEGYVQVKLEKEGKKIKFSVHDTGIGMEADALDNIFTKFYRATDAVKVKPDGTGIGLYVCKTIVEAHKGTVSAESERGRGSTFTAVMPIKQ